MPAACLQHAALARLMETYNFSRIAATAFVAIVIAHTLTDAVISTCCCYLEPEVCHNQCVQQTFDNVKSSTLYSYGLHRYGLWHYGLWHYGLCSYGDRRSSMWNHRSCRGSTTERRSWFTCCAPHPSRSNSSLHRHDGKAAACLAVCSAGSKIRQAPTRTCGRAYQ